MYLKLNFKSDSNTVKTSWSNQAGESFEALGQPINYWHLAVDCGRWSVPWSNCENRNGPVITVQLIFERNKGRIVDKMLPEPT